MSHSIKLKTLKTLLLTWADRKFETVAPPVSDSIEYSHSEKRSSGTNAKVGTSIFIYLLFPGFLKDKTRILVTHQLQYLNHVDQILFLNNVSFCSCF